MKIALLISGGVDSSVALRLLAQQGHEVTAFYLKIWLEDELSYLGSCPWQEDLAYVQAVCEQAQVPLEVVSLQQEYWDKVVAYTIDQVKNGLTPNPDIFCNKLIKFGVFFDYLASHGRHFDKIASGHYAQVREANGTCELVCAADAVKDQTYFLAYLQQDQLARLIFPIGHLPKSQVRALAHFYNLPNKDRKDSQGICFLGKLKFSDFLHHYLGEQPGDLIEFETNKKVGEHRGFWYYTHGQRQGIGLAGGPWYVVHKDPAANRVYISRSYYESDKMRDRCVIANLHWFSGHEPAPASALRVKLRHGASAHACSMRKAGDFFEVVLANHDQGIAPGQFAVFYADDVCLGAGVIHA